MNEKMETVSAGDIEKYAYCPLSWWLSKQHKSVYKEGIKKHKETEKDLKEIKTKEEKLRIYEKFVLIFSIAATIVAIIGILFLYGKTIKTWNIYFIVLAFLWLYNSLFFLYKEGKVIKEIRPRYEKIILISAAGAIMVAAFSIIFSLPPNPDIGRFAEVLALLWVISANLLFYHSMNVSEEVIEKKIKYAPINGKIEYVGADKGKEMTSYKYGIRGKPDYIIKVGNEYIPVEEKSMSMDHPRFSHVMQITAYCMLVEDIYGIAPSYGIIKYSNREFKIPYEERWKKLVIKIRENMLKDMERGEAHRNHNNKKKCATCVRRDFCPERLV